MAPRIGNSLRGFEIPPSIHVVIYTAGASDGLLWSLVLPLAMGLSDVGSFLGYPNWASIQTRRLRFEHSTTAEQASVSGLRSDFAGWPLPALSSRRT
jgi:hypothetical protein